MSILHVNQIAGALERQFNNMIDLSDVTANVKSRLKGRLARNRPAREKLFDSNHLNHCIGISR